MEMHDPDAAWSSQMQDTQNLCPSALPLPAVEAPARNTPRGPPEVCAPTASHDLVTVIPGRLRVLSPHV